MVLMLLRSTKYATLYQFTSLHPSMPIRCRRRRRRRRKTTVRRQPAWGRCEADRRWNVIESRVKEDDDREMLAGMGPL